MKKTVLFLLALFIGYSFTYAKQTSNYLKNGSFEAGLNLDWEYFISEKADAKFSLFEENKIFDDGSVGLRVDVNKLDGQNSVYARTRATVGSDSLYLLQFWAHGPEEAELYVSIDGAEQKGVKYGMRVGNNEDKGKMVAYHYPFKIDKSQYNKELVITFYFRSTVTKDKSNDPNDCKITTTAGATYLLDGLVLVDQSNDMHHDVYDTYLWNYKQVPNKDNQSWTAGDNDVSFDLPDGRRMWFFNDSFYGRNLANSNIFPGGTFTRNAVVIEELDGSLNSLPITNQGGQWTFFRIPDADVIYNTAGNPSSGVKNCFWVGDAIIEDGMVKVYLIEVYGNDRSYLGKFTYPELEFVGIEEQEPFCRTYEKFFVEDDMIYLYASGGSGWTRTMKVARAELGDLNGKKGTWRFWDGQTWTVEDKKYEVSQRGADDVMKLGEGNYVQLSMPVMSPEVYVRFAPSPEGPWEHEQLVGIGDRSANFWYYMPNFHRQLPNGKYPISLSANYHGCLFFCKDCENQLYTDKYWYRQRYIQVDLLALSPYTTNKKDCFGVENGNAYYDDCGECVGGTTGKQACVTAIAKLYSESNFEGNLVGINVGEYSKDDLDALGFTDNDLSSIDIKDGYVVELFDEDNFKGDTKIVSSAIADLKEESFNDKATSIVVRRLGVNELSGVYAIQNKQSGLYLGVENQSISNYSLLEQAKYNGDDSQKFKIESVGKGYHKITNVGSNLSLGIARFSTEAKANVEQWDGVELDIMNFGGIVSAQYDNSQPKYNVENIIDNNKETHFIANYGKVWVQFEPVIPTILISYAITAANDSPGRAPYNWILYGSNDGENWVNLDEQNKVLFERLEEKTFSISNETSYTHYRLDMECRAGTKLYIAEWKLFEKNISEQYKDFQKFIIQSVNDSCFRFINKKTDMLLEVLDGINEEGTKVWQMNDIGQLGGLWILRDPDEISASLSKVISDKELSIYPNPAQDFIVIESKSAEKIKRITAVDLGGNIILDTYFNEDRINIGLSNWNKGVFLLKVYTEEGFYTHKLIKK